MCDNDGINSKDKNKNGENNPEFPHFHKIP